jgi:hypothetical protein
MRLVWSASDIPTLNFAKNAKFRMGHPDGGVLFDSLVDGGSVFFGQAIAHEVVVDPHEPADYPALIVPAPHHRLHLAWGVVLVPHAWENRHFSKIPTRAWIVPSTAGIGLKMDSVYRARAFFVDS